MNATLARYRIESGWPELLLPDFPATEALRIAADIHRDAIADAQETAHLKGYEEAQAEYQPAADRVPELEEQAERLQERIDDLQEALSEALEGDLAGIMRAKLLAVHAECSDACTKIAARMLTATKQSERRQFMRELAEAMRVAFYTAMPKTKD